MGKNEAAHADSASTAARRSRWWCDIRWISASVVGLSITSLLWLLFGPEPAIRVSRETTCVTEPLAADGLPDYAAAWVQMAGPAPPPEENAAVVLLEACWPLGIDGDLLAACRALGIPSDPPTKSLREPHADAASGISREKFDSVAGRPWKAAEFPELEAWLRANQVAIDQIVAASKRPRYWLPMGGWLPAHAGLPVTASRFHTAIRAIGRILMCRAMLHIGEHRYADAWRDSHALSRLARLMVAPENRPLDALVLSMALMLERHAHRASTFFLLRNVDLPRELLVTMSHDLDALGPPANVANVIIAERFGVLSNMLAVADPGGGGRGARVRRYASHVSKDNSFAMWTSLDWNHLLGRFNETLEQFDAALRLPTHADRRAMIHEVHQDQLDERAAWKPLSRRFTVLVNRAARTEYVFSVTRWEMVADPGFWLGSVTEHQTRCELMRVAVAIALWKLDHPAVGYPERLEDLVPKVLPAVPIDLYSNQPLIYERRGDGYLLASVGPNGVYDGGDDFLGAIIRGEWQSSARKVAWDKCDYVIRMPIPDDADVANVLP